MKWHGAGCFTHLAVGFRLHAERKCSSSIHPFRLCSAVVSFYSSFEITEAWHGHGHGLGKLAGEGQAK